MKSLSDKELDEFYRLWSEFGRNINIVAILTLLTIFTGITGFVAIIFFIISLGNIRMINSRIKSLYLHDFRSKMISSFILKLISLCLLVGGGIGIGFSTFFWFNVESVYTAASIVSIILSSFVTLIGLILGIIGFSVEMKAWQNFKLYIEENRSMFSDYVVRETLSGAENLRMAALMYALGFLGITIIIGYILQIMGFFKLRKFNSGLRVNYRVKPKVAIAPNVPLAPIAPTPPERPAVPTAPFYNREITNPYKTPTQESFGVNRVLGMRPNFCPNCGAQVKEDGVYCPECGSSLS